MEVTTQGRDDALRRAPPGAHTEATRTAGMDRLDERRHDGLPSSHASSRLSSEVSREVADLRVRLHEAVLRSDAYLAAGRPDAAAEVLAEQHALVARFRERLAAAAAAAKVEHEAEQALGPDLVLLDGGLEDEPAVADAPPARLPRPIRSPDRTPALVAGVLVALALLGLANLADRSTEVDVLSAGDIGALPSGDEPASTDFSALAAAAERVGENLLAALASSGDAPTDDPTITTEWRRLVDLRDRATAGATRPGDLADDDAAPRPPLVGAVVDSADGLVRDVVEQVSRAGAERERTGTDGAGDERAVPAPAAEGGTDTDGADRDDEGGESGAVGEQSDTGVPPSPSATEPLSPVQPATGGTSAPAHEATRPGDGPSSR